MMESMNEIMTVKEVANYLKTCPMTIYRKAKKGELPCFKVGGDWRFRREAVSQWILSQECNGATNSSNVVQNLNEQTKSFKVVNLSAN